MSSLTFNDLREANTTRCNEHFHALDAWSGAEWGNAMAGEYGEVAEDLLQVVLKFMSTLKACDTLKKALRQLETDEDFGKLRSRLSLELADVITYADLIAARFDINLGEAVKEKFNEVSDKRDSSIKL